MPQPQINTVNCCDYFTFFSTLLYPLHDITLSSKTTIREMPMQLLFLSIFYLLYSIKNGRVVWVALCTAINPVYLEIINNSHDI